MTSAPDRGPAGYAPSEVWISPGTPVAVLLLILVSVLMFVPVNYVVLRPGPTPDTLGEAGEPPRPLITIRDRETFPTDGTLRLTTVGVEGVPGAFPRGWEVLAGWLHPRAAAVPAEVVYRPGETAEQAESANLALMSESRQDAVDAAMGYLDVPPVGTFVREVPGDAAARDQLEPGDEILRIDDLPAGPPQAVREAVGNIAPGQEIRVRVRRDKKEGEGTEQITRRIRLGSRPQEPSKGSLGISIGAVYPFAVDIAIDDVGGPSAGLMFALGIIDKLTPGALNGAKPVAGTGAIDAAGAVEPIGGIRQKLAGARAAGAEYFLVPEENCAEALLKVPEGLTLAKVRTLGEAVDILGKISRGEAVPPCTASAEPGQA